MDNSREQFFPHQSPAAPIGTQPPEAADGGSIQQPSDGIRTRPQPAVRIRTTNHILTAEEVMELVRKAGVGRSIRRVTEYCQRGDLDAFRDPNERRWYVTPARGSRSNRRKIYGQPDHRGISVDGYTYFHQQK